MTEGLEAALSDVLAWSRATFPDREALPTAVHLRREAAELCAALARGESAAEELADVVILAVALADCLHVDLAEVVTCKLVLLTTRRWAPPDAEGVREHVRTETDS